MALEAVDVETITTGQALFGKKQEISKALRTNRKRCYTYILRRPSGEPFYVGKGIDFRIFGHEIEADGDVQNYKLNIIRSIRRQKAEILYEIDQWHSDETAAFVRERALIGLIGRSDLGRGPLANLTDGGEGTSNPSPISKEKHRLTLGGIAGDGSERDIVNDYFFQLHPDAKNVRSIPVKPLSDFQPCKARPNKKPGNGKTPRQSLALFASGLAHRVMMQPRCRIPRRFIIHSVPAIIEGGVLSRMINSGFVNVESGSRPDEEVLILTEHGFNELIEPYQDSITTRPQSASASR